MPDHLHVFVSAAGSQAVSRWVGSLKIFLTKHLKASGQQGPFWQDGFFDHIMRSGESYSAKWEYVVQNSVRAGLASEAKDWPFAGEIEVLAWD